MPCDLVEGFIKRLSMFILRSIVAIKLRDDLTVYGLIGAQSDLPAVDEITLQGEVVLARVADWGNQKRVMAIGPETVLVSHYPEAAESARWFESEIETSTPWVFAKTKEAFIPQWINLDLIGGLVFDKGCYPGQEIISRMQHLGKTPRRLALLKSDSKVLVEPKSDVFLNGEAVGQAVMSVQLHGKTLVLVSMSDKNSDQKDAFEIKNKQFLRLYDK